MVFIKPTKEDLDNFIEKYKDITSPPTIQPGFIAQPIPRRRRNKNLLDKIKEYMERGKYY